MSENKTPKIHMRTVSLHISDPTFERIFQLAEIAGISPSALLTSVITNYIEQHTPDHTVRTVLFAIAGWIARMESRRRSERTKAGLAKTLLSQKIEKANELSRQGLSQGEIAKLLGVTRSSVFNWLSEYPHKDKARAI